MARLFCCVAFKKLPRNDHGMNLDEYALGAVQLGAYVCARKRILMQNIAPARQLFGLAAQGRIEAEVGSRLRSCGGEVVTIQGSDDFPRSIMTVL